MKRRYVHYMLNLFSFTLLLFALYLNFVKKESEEIAVAPADVSASPSAKTDAKAETEPVNTVVVLK